MEYKHIALVPAYQPGTILLEVLDRLKKQGMDIVLVDDGSGAEFSDIFASAALQAELLTHPVNKGKGAALKTGMKYIMADSGQRCVVVTVDADGQHQAADAARLCRIAESCPNALILGSRRLEEHVPLRSRFGNTITRLVYRAVTGLKVHDTQTGLRAFDSRLIPRLLSVPGERYEYEMNVLMEFAREGIPIKEAEIATIYINNNSSSHFSTVRDSVRIYWEILKFSVSSFASFLIDYSLYALLLFMTHNLRAANIGARLVSSAANYTLNRRFVFKCQNGIMKSAFQYFLLASVILSGNTLLLEFFVSSCGISQMAAKLLTEIIFFALSWLIQKTIIFQRKEQTYEN